MLIVWGRNDQIFPAAGAEAYKRDLKTVEFHLLDAGHFALESDGDLIARLMLDFLGRHVAAKEPSPNQKIAVDKGVDMEPS
jgi:pimeloyl-ACP methyl ester carboxylesterase